MLDVIETSRPEIRRQWQLHSVNRPEIGDRLLTLANEAPEVNWADPALKPKSRVGRLFCQTLLPRDYRLILHGDGKANAFGPSGKPRGAVAGNTYHRQYGRHVVQIDPDADAKETVFLHVLTATETEETNPPDVSYRVSGPGQIELKVAGAKAKLVVPAWFTRSP